MTKIEDVEKPMIAEIEEFINENPEEVFRPKEVTERLDLVPDSARSALSSLHSQNKIERLRLSQSKSYYGTKEAIEELRERIDID